MKKFASILLAGLMALSLFAGCSSEVTSTDDGSSAAQASSSGTESQAESNGSSEDAYAGLSGTLTLNGSTSMTAVCNALGEAFMAKYDGVTVEKAEYRLRFRCDRGQRRDCLNRRLVQKGKGR